MLNKENMEQPEVEQVEVADAKNENEVQNEEQEKINERATSISTNGSIGKFKDTESLFNAYNSLQAEFTRKCQKLSELENSISKNNSSKEEFDVNEFKKENPELVHNIVQSYLDELRSTSTPEFISNSLGSGIPLNAPPNPKTMEEARVLAKNLFK